MKLERQLKHVAKCHYFHLKLFLMHSLDRSSEPNPHMGHLAWADAFVITADSVGQISEACSTGYDGEKTLSFFCDVLEMLEL